MSNETDTRTRLQAENAALHERIALLEKAQQALDHPMNILNRLISNLPFPIFYKDAAGVYLGCNESFARAIFGLAACEVVGKTVYDLLPEEEARFYHAADTAVLQQGETQVYEKVVRYHDGSLHSIIFHKSIFCSADGARLALSAR